MKHPDICPRCESPDPEVLSRSPVAGAWVVYGCPACFFTWRSTEPDFITDPAKYDVNFKLDAGTLDQLAVMPNIPPLKRG